MLIIVPNQPDGIAELVENLQSYKLSDIVSRYLRRRRVLLEMPKFSVSYHTSMNSFLQSLSIKKIFGENAELENMVNQNDLTLHVDEIIHAARIDVWGKGAKASAATRK